MNPVSYLRSRRRLNLILIIIWMGVIFAGSATSQQDIPSALGPIAKVLHLGEYAILAFLSLPYFSSSKRPILATLIFAFLYASSDELHQLFVPGRHSNPFDVLIDAVGASLGVLLSRRWGRG
jgi:VanZ family protein